MENATPSRAARSNAGRSVDRDSSSHAPRRPGSRYGVRSPTRWGRNKVSPGIVGLSSTGIELGPGRAKHLAGPVQGQSGVHRCRHRVPTPRRRRAVQVRAGGHPADRLGHRADDLRSGADGQLNLAERQTRAQDGRGRVRRSGRYGNPGGKPQLLGRRRAQTGDSCCGGHQRGQQARVQTEIQHGVDVPLIAGHIEQEGGRGVAGFSVDAAGQPDTKPILGLQRPAGIAVTAGLVLGDPLQAADRSYPA